MMLTGSNLNYDLFIKLDDKLKVVHFPQESYRFFEDKFVFEVGSYLLDYIKPSHIVVDLKNIDFFLDKPFEAVFSSNTVYKDISFCFVRDGDFINFFGKDITEEKRTAYNLHQMSKYAKVGYWEQTPDGNTIWSDEVYKIFEITQTSENATYSKELVSSCIVGDYLNLLSSHIIRLFEFGEPYELELEIETPNNNRKWIRTTGVAIWRDGVIVQGRGMCQDVTSYRNSLTQLYESQHHLQFALEANNMGTWHFDFESRELVWDKTMCEIYGISINNSPKTTDEFLKLVHPEDLPKVIYLTSDLDSSDFAKSDSFRIIVNDEVRHIAVRIGQTVNHGRKFYIGVNWDITKDKMNEDIIRAQQAKIISSGRLSALGEMAGGIAHEINNPLSAILMRAGQLKRKNNRGELTDSELQDGLDKIEVTCSRIVKIINGLRTLSRDGENDPFEVVSLKDCINDVASLTTEKFLVNGVSFKIDFPFDDILVNARLVQIEQVLMNLINNSYDSIVNCPIKEITCEIRLNGSDVNIRIWDSGQGVPRNIQDKIFEPFFTTKDVGSGTGIGLSISRSILLDHGGDISYVDAHDFWCFLVRLPIL